MGRILNGILGGVQGKVSGVVGGNWRGINYIRAYAKPANPRTTLQTNQRNKFSSALKFAKSLLGTVIAEFWNNVKPGMSGINAFMSSNIRLISSDNMVNTNNVVSIGPLEPLQQFNATYTPSTGDILFDWSSITSSNGLPTDNVSLVIYDNTRQYSRCYMFAATRNQQVYNATLPDGLTESQTLVAFAIVSRVEDGKLITSLSNSYLVDIESA